MYKYVATLVVALFISLSGQSERVDSLKSELQKGIEDTTRLKILSELAELLIKYNLEESLSYANKGLELCESIGSLTMLYQFRGQVADIHKRIGDYNLAAKYYAQNLEQAIQLSDTVEMRDAYLALGAVYNNLGEFEKSVSSLVNAADLARITGDKKSQAGIYANLGLTLISQNDPDRALTYLEESLNLYKQLDNKIQIIVGYLRLGRVFVKKDDNPKALEYELNALEEAEKLDNKSILATTYSELASTQLNMDNLEESKRYGGLSLAIREGLGSKRAIASTKYTLGAIEIELGNYEQALNILLDSQELWVKMGAKEQIMEGLKVISKAYRKAGNYEKAYEYFYDYAELRDSILNEETAKQIKETETKYNVKEKQAQLDLQEKELANQRNILIASFVVAFLLITMLILAYRIMRQRKKINEQLKALDASKSRFFANISHELRTPLTLILAPLKNLLEKYPDKNLQTELKLIQSSGEKLLSLTEEVMELSKLESGKLELNESPVNINDLCKRIFYSYQSLAQFRQLKYNFKCNVEESTTVKIDANKFEKILHNLLSNAFKHSHSGGLIELSISLSNGSLKFSVKDDGEGIHPSDLPHIFDRYYQTALEDVPERGGAGIGLSIANEFSKALRGNVEVKSEWQTGSEFILSIPFNEAEIKIDKKVSKEPLEESHSKDVTVSKPLLIDGKKPGILVVEDNLEMSRYITGLLSDEYICTVAPDGKEALKIMERSRFDLIISDIMMPNMDGFEFRENVVKEPDWKLTPFIMLTARTPEEDKLKGFLLGIDDYITKPFSPRELFARICALLNNKAQRDEWYSQHRDELPEEQQVTAEEKLVNDAKEFVIENLDNVKFTASELAGKLAYSQRQLERLLKKNTGFTPNSFIREIRLLHAYKMLERKQFHTVVEVCYEVGFENPSYFSKKFAERFGKKPSEV